MLDLTTIRRERVLPEEALGGVETGVGATVNLRDIVARGSVPSRYVIVEAAAFFGLKQPEALDELLQVVAGSVVDRGSPLAVRKNKRLLSPVPGVVAYAGDGRVIIQEEPQEIELEAGLEGEVVNLVQEDRGVVIETSGALLQGVWGNQRRVIGALRLEPEAGLESIEGDQLNNEYRGAIVVTRRPLKDTGLLIMADQNLGGVIAPSMEADLITPALHAEGAVMLTEGFGGMRMSNAIWNTLASFAGRQGMLDAFLPNRWEARRPEVIINVGRSSGRATRPNPDLTLQIGTQVRLTRPPNAGQVGKVIHLPKIPYLLDNGLRVRCAQIELVAGERVMVPLVNLEVFGR